MRSSGNTILIAAVIAALVSYGVAHVVIPKDGGLQTAAKETVLDRIKRTGVIRCGYIVSPPYLLKDPNTGQMNGLAYDLMQAIGKELDVRIEWTEETGWGTFHEGLNGNRYDLMCVPVWQSGGRAKAALLSRPLYYNSMFAVARENDNRFEKPESINKPDVRVAYFDGDPTQDIHDQHFPLAQGLALPQSADFSQGFMNVVTNKVDIWFDNYDNIQRFNKNSPQKIKIVANGLPLGIFADVIPMPQGEFELKAVLDAVIESIYNSGAASAIIQKYAPSIQEAASGYMTVKP